MKYPVYHGRGQNVNRDFKVMKLPRLILVNQDGTIHTDIIFMKEPALRKVLEEMLLEIALKETEEKSESE
jgi:hypothetical protein